MKDVRKIMETGGKISYFRNTNYYNLTGTANGSPGHYIILGSREHEWLTIMNNSGNFNITNNVRVRLNLDYMKWKYHLKNNDQTPNDYIITYGKVKKDIPAYQLIGGTSKTYTDISTWFSDSIKSQTYYTDTGYTAATDAGLLAQYDFKPKDMWVANKFIKWGKSHNICLKPGQRHTLKLNIPALRTSWKDYSQQTTGVAGQVPTTNSALADQNILAYKGNTVLWLTARGTIGNLGNLATPAWGNSNLMRAHTDCITTVHGKMSFMPTIAWNSTAFDTSTNLSTATTYAVQEAVGVYTT